MAEKLKCYLVSYNGVKNAGGVEKVCYYLQQIMIQKGFEVVIVDKGLIERSFLGQVYLQIFKKLHIVSFSFLASLFVANKRKNGDIKIAHGFNAPFFRTDYLFVHGTMKGYATAVGSVVGRSAKILFWLEKKACINAQKILSVSQNAIEEIKKFYTKRDLNFTVVNNGVDPTAFFPKKKNDVEKYITVLYCGRLDYGKGVDKLLELADAIEGSNEFYFKIACNNAHNTHLFSHFTRTSVSIGLEGSEALNKFYNSGNVMFFPSMYEGFEMVTLEALCAGIPVLGRQVGAVGEFVKNNDPGVELINEDFLAQIKRLHEQNNNQREFLHSYYGTKYGLQAYTRRLNAAFGEIIVGQFM